MSTPLGLPQAFNWDSLFPDIPVRMYRNDVLDDCVIATRAHHTVRLVHKPGQPYLNITDDEVAAEFFKEDDATGGGLDLRSSLASWQTPPGWKAGGVSGRVIDGFQDHSAALAGDLTTAVGQMPIVDLFLQSGGLQVELKLPDSIGPAYPGSYGPDAIWNDTTAAADQPHVMLLTGFDPLGLFGVTWGQRQTMSWPFFKEYARALFSVQGGLNT